MRLVLTFSSFLVQVYSYFLGIYKVSVGVGIAGYALLVLEFCGIGTFLRPAIAPSACLMLLWYGLYFGVLGRDCAEVAADRMVSLLLENISPHLPVMATPGFHGCASQLKSGGHLLLYYASRESFLCLTLAATAMCRSAGQHPQGHAASIAPRWAAMLWV